jgi:hypothetical protein
MFTRLRQRLAARAHSLAPALPLTEHLPEVTVTQRALVLDALLAAHIEGRGLVVRDLHRLARLPQPVVLRCIHNLEQEGVVQLDEVLHDPLASVIRLT